jgi:hypothetical protein
LLLVLLGAAFVASQGQQTLPGQQGMPSQVGQRSQSPFGPLFNDQDNDAAFAQRQIDALNAARQKALVSDTDKLLKLAQELNSEIAVNDPASLTSDQVRKIASIEKLARNVRQKMSESIVTGPSLRDPILPVR